MGSTLNHNLDPPATDVLRRPKDTSTYGLVDVCDGRTTIHCTVCLLRPEQVLGGRRSCREETSQIPPGTTRVGEDWSGWFLGSRDPGTTYDCPGPQEPDRTLVGEGPRSRTGVDVLPCIPSNHSTLTPGSAPRVLGKSETDHSVHDSWSEEVTFYTPPPPQTRIL